MSLGGRLFARGPGWKHAKILFPLALALALSGCGVFRGPPPVTYDLAAPESIPLQARTAAQIMIPEPRALRALDSERIVVRTGPKMSYYPNAQWPDRLPKVFQARAIEAFERSKRVRAVGQPGEGLSIDYQLVIEIRSFEYVTGSYGGFAKVEVSAKVLNDRNGRVVSTKILTGEAAVERDDAVAVVAGVNAALNDVLVELVRWTIERI